MKPMVIEGALLSANGFNTNQVFANTGSCHMYVILRMYSSGNHLLIVSPFPAISWSIGGEAKTYISKYLNFLLY